MTYDNLPKIPLVDIEHRGRLLSPKIAIVALDWETMGISVLEVIDYKVKGRSIKSIANERVKYWMVEYPNAMIHKIWNFDMHTVNNNRIMV